MDDRSPTDVATHRYPPASSVPPLPDYPAMEADILATWTADDTFAASVAQRSSSPEYVFYDGPPFANGLPHYGHLLTGFVKDALPRFMTMRGYHVERRFGWDCHGLPAEVEAERELGVSGRGPITAFGVDRFNDYCRTSVLRYTAQWERYVTRQARWVDFTHDYKTMDIDYMESVMWAFATLYRKGLVYEGYRVLPYCWECETPLANFETRQDDAYRDRVDPAVTVAIDFAGPTPDLLRHARMLVWTTTPWTLPSNLAVAVGPDITYAVVELGDSRYVIAEERLRAYDELAAATRLGSVRGRDLVGLTYTPIFDYFADHERSFRVLAAEFVTTDDGTGIVHLAPGFGEDDQRTCEENGIDVVCPVDDRGRFDDRVPDLTGTQVFAANDTIIAALRARGALVRAEEITHSYPHCWRTDTPLIYRAVSSFFVAVTKIKDRMLELNQEINWVPAHVRDGAFGRWLEGARDWSISRNRFWGSPIPVWKSDDPAYPRVDVYGSLDEIERDFGRRPDDLHRPSVDELRRPNPDDPSGRAQMVRVTDVLDCWFDSGSMPFAQLHYPFEHSDDFASRYPADFICEYIGQTRGWFYTLHVLATALFDAPAYRNVLAHGVLLGEDARKLSKRLKNYPDPEAFFATEGADAMRWYLLSSAVLRGNDVVIEEHAMAEPVRQVLNPIWNTWHFLCLYAESDGVVGHVRHDQQGLLDRYVLAKLAALVSDVTDAMAQYDLALASAEITSFLEALTNWYVRRSRERFWRPMSGGAGDADKHDAYDTLHTVLETLCRITAPLLPLLTERIYRDLTGARSVHLADWPSPQVRDDDLVAAMDLVREVCSAGHSIRKATGLRARLPLPSLTVAGAAASSLAPFADLIAEELNVKHVELEVDASTRSTTKLTLVPQRLGPRLGDDMQRVMAAYRRGEFEVGTEVSVGGVALEPGEYELRHAPIDERSARVLERHGAVVVLDTATTDALEREGIARDLIRIVQQRRKDLDLRVTDRISVAIEGDEALAPIVEEWAGEIAAQTLATDLAFSTATRPGHHKLANGATVAVIVASGGSHGA